VRERIRAPWPGFGRRGRGLRRPVIRGRPGIVGRVQQALQFRQHQQVFGATGRALGPDQARQIEGPDLAIEGRDTDAVRPDLGPTAKSRDLREKVNPAEVGIQCENSPAAKGLLIPDKRKLRWEASGPVMVRPHP
jgi:hypothetical protein